MSSSSSILLILVLKRSTTRSFDILLMYFSVFERMSYALVLKSNRPLKILDRVKNP